MVGAVEGIGGQFGFHFFEGAVHTLEHSFAPHLLEKGVDLHCIQDLIGMKAAKRPKCIRKSPKKVRTT